MCFEGYIFNPIKVDKQATIQLKNWKEAYKNNFYDNGTNNDITMEPNPSKNRFLDNAYMEGWIPLDQFGTVNTYVAFPINDKFSYDRNQNMHGLEHYGKELGLARKLNWWQGDWGCS